MQTNKLIKYLDTKYKNRSDYVIIGSNLYSKTSISFQTLQDINDISSIRAIYYLSENCKPFKLGFKLGLCFIQS